MELIKIINARNVLEGFSEKEDVSARLAYWMAKFMAKTEVEYNFYVAETRKLYDKYAVIEGDKLVVSPENVEAFKTEAEKLQKTEIEDPGIRFSLSDLSSELKLSMRQMYSLLDFIDEDK